LTPERNHHKTQIYQLKTLNRIPLSSTSKLHRLPCSPMPNSRTFSIQFVPPPTVVQKTSTLFFPQCLFQWQSSASPSSKPLNLSTTDFRDRIINSSLRGRGCYLGHCRTFSSLYPLGANNSPL
uniref:Uncharacterized protein n=1 Tax=Piliocolobus tephrosceles TaxID=591936 RepID=A0A8C9HPX1_9PRIM